MLARGISVLPVDIYKSLARKFVVEGDKIRLPFLSIAGVGETAADSLATQGKEGDYLSIEDLQMKTKISKTVVETLKKIGTFKDLPESTQISLF